MAALSAVALDTSSLFPPPATAAVSSSSSASSCHYRIHLSFKTCASNSNSNSNSSSKQGWVLPLHKNPYSFRRQLICRAAAEYKFPDPIPEFADSETERFKTHLVKKLSKKDLYGDSLDQVVGICTEIFSDFLHAEYGGPGTLLVLPFIDMADALNERGLPGGPQAARAAVKWATDNVDKDWKEWTSGKSK